VFQTCACPITGTGSARTSRTLSVAEAGERGVEPARFWPIQFQVPGSICITPTAPVLETRSLLKPLSCQPIAAASDGDPPLAAAIEPMSDALTVCGVGYGPEVVPAAAVETGCETVLTVLGAPERLSTEPASSVPFGA